MQKQISVQKHTECTCTPNPVAYSVAHPGTVGGTRDIPHSVCSAAVAAGGHMKTQWFEKLKPVWYIRRYIRGTFGYIRVHSGYIRVCSAAAAVGGHMKTQCLRSSALDAGTFAACTSPFYNNKREGTERGQAQAPHGHGGGGEGYRILPPRVGVISHFKN